jgi:hypothetical protein
VQFASYTDFRDKVHVMLDGDDISTSDLSVNVLDLVIGAGEQRIYRELRTSTQDVPFTGTTTANAAPLPADFLEFHGAPYVATFTVAVYAPWERLQNMINRQASVSSWYGNTNHPVYYGFQSDSVLFYPQQPDGVTVSGQYYKRFPDISTGLNALFTRHPDVFLYASLAESAQFVGEQSRGDAWEAKLTKLLSDANAQELRRYTRGGKLSTRLG